MTLGICLGCHALLWIAIDPARRAKCPRCQSRLIPTDTALGRQLWAGSPR